MNFLLLFSFVSIKIVVFYSRDKIIPATDGQCLKCSILTMCQHVICRIAVDTPFLSTNETALIKFKIRNYDTPLTVFRLSSAPSAPMVYHQVIPSWLSRHIFFYELLLSVSYHIHYPLHMMVHRQPSLVQVACPMWATHITIHAYYTVTLII